MFENRLAMNSGSFFLAYFKSKVFDRWGIPNIREMSSDVKDTYWLPILNFPSTLLYVSSQNLHDVFIIFSASLLCNLLFNLEFIRNQKVVFFNTALCAMFILFFMRSNSSTIDIKFDLSCQCDFAWCSFFVSSSLFWVLSAVEIHIQLS